MISAVMMSAVMMSSITDDFHTNTEFILIEYLGCI